MRRNGVKAVLNCKECPFIGELAKSGMIFHACKHPDQPTCEASKDGTLRHIECGPPHWCPLPESGIDHELRSQLRVLDPSTNMLAYTGYSSPVQWATGLRDKNGRAVYEGDILQGVNIWDRKKLVLLVVKFEPIRHDESDEAMAYGFTPWPDWIESSEVVGNVHENPELVPEEDLASLISAVSAA